MRRDEEKGGSKQCIVNSVAASRAEVVANSELEKGESMIIKFDQTFDFKEQVTAVKGSECVKKSCALARLDSILTDGRLRISGRLNRATLGDDAKHHIIIPKDSHLARLLTNQDKPLSQKAATLVRNISWLC